MTSDLVPMYARLAGALLRHHRQAARWTVEEAADVLECDASKISRIETGRRKPDPRDVQALLAAYGVSREEKQAIAVLIRDARAGWWSEYRGLLPDDLVDQVMLESVAGSLMVYQPLALPAFLQTPGYAGAVTAADPALQTGEAQRLAVDLTARRAAAIRERQHDAVTVVISEAVLMQQVGGSAVMLDQLRRIAGEAEALPAPAVLRVIPFAAGAHPAIGAGPVSIMRFPGVTGIGAICQGWDTAAVSVAGQDELTTAVRRFEALRDTALSTGASMKLVRTLISTWQ